MSNEPGLSKISRVEQRAGGREDSCQVCGNRNGVVHSANGLRWRSWEPGMGLAPRAEWDSTVQAGF